MNTSELHRKFLQSGEKQGKYMLKPIKHRNFVNDGTKIKSKKKKLVHDQIKSDFKESSIPVEVYTYY